MINADFVNSLLSDLMAGAGRSPDISMLFQQTSLNFHDDELAMALTNLWRYVLTDVPTLPRLGAAKRLVELAKRGDSSFPILTTEGTIIESLTKSERLELFDFIKEILGDDRASIGASCLAEFADELLTA